MVANISGLSSPSLLSSTIRTASDGTQVSIQPKVVDAGHHQRRLLRLTGLDVEEIAHVIGEGFETVKSRLRYAFAKLRVSLEAAP